MTALRLCLAALLIPGATLAAPKAPPKAPVVEKIAAPVKGDDAKPDAPVEGKITLKKKKKKKRSSGAPEDARAVWLRLGGMKNACPGEYTDYTYGALRSLTCHLASRLPGKTLQAWAGAPIFIKGPHTLEKFNFKDPKRFGHYNPKFVTWAVDNLAPGVADAKFRGVTQPIYDRFVKRYATGLYRTYAKARAERACFDAQVKAYSAWLGGKKMTGMPYGRFYYFLNDAFCAHPSKGWRFFSKQGGDNHKVTGIRGHLVSAATAWWIRRTLDGTAAEWWRGLEALISAYDPQLAGAAKAAPKPIPKAAVKAKQPIAPPKPVLKPKGH